MIQLFNLAFGLSMKKLKNKCTILILLSLTFLYACSSSKTDADIMTIETHQKELDSLLSGLDSKYKEFEVEIDALRDTYDEDHKTLEDLYRLNAESRTSISNLEEDIKTRFSEV